MTEHEHILGSSVRPSTYSLVHSWLMSGRRQRGRGRGVRTDDKEDKEQHHLNNGEYYETIQGAEAKVLLHPAFKNIKDADALPIAKKTKKADAKKDADAWGGFLAGFNNDAYHTAMETVGKYMSPGNLWNQDFGLKLNCCVFTFR